MAGSTPNLILPYPDADDSADVPRDIKALADRLDLLMSAAPTAPRPIVTSLPPAPYDGQEVVLRLPDANNGLAGATVLWGLRYNATSTYPFKWEFTGGTPLSAHSDATLRSPLANTTAWQTIASTPSLTLPYDGDYDVTIEGALGMGGAGYYAALLSYTVGPSAPSDVWAARAVFNNNMQSVVKTWRHTQVTGTRILAERLRCNNTGAGVNMNISDRSLRAVPVRLKGV
jgi:hypothetical protein